MALSVDIDELRVRIGGWQTQPDSKLLARNLGFGMAAEHLRSGHDVVLPQLLLNGEVVDHLREIATDAGGQFVEVVLVASTDELTGRLRDSHGKRPHPRNLFSVDDLESQVGSALEALNRLAAERSTSLLIDVSGLSADAAASMVQRTIGWS